MAGDLDLTPISSVPSIDRTQAEQTQEFAQRPVRFRDQDFERADVSQERRDALVNTITEDTPLPNGKLVIERDQDTGKYVQKIVNPVTGEVIRQWPEEEFLELARQIGEAYGLLVDRSI